MERFADLHIHTHYSDSSSSPEDVVRVACECGLRAIAITDHDTVDGIASAVDFAKNSDLEVLSGIELSSEIYQRDIHILGYCFDREDAEFLKQIGLMQDSRVCRMEKMIEKLKGVEVGNIELEEVCALAESRSVGRPHLAAVLVAKGWVRDIKQAFDQYLAEGKLAYVPKYKQSPFEAIASIKKAGGVAVLAHPMVTKMDEIIPELVRKGLDGIEVYYPNTPKTIIHYYEGIARKHRLLMTGGSDDHGSSSGNTFIGKTQIPYSLVEQLKSKCQQVK